MMLHPTRSMSLQGISWVNLPPACKRILLGMASEMGFRSDSMSLRYIEYRMLMLPDNNSQPNSLAPLPSCLNWDIDGLPYMRFGPLTQKGSSICEKHTHWSLNQNM